MSDRATLNALLLAKNETTVGTDAAPVAGTDAIQLIDMIDPSGEYVFQRMRDKALVGNGFQGLSPLKPSGPLATWTAKLFPRATRSTTAISSVNLPDPDPLLMAAGLGATLVTTGGSESNTYKPASTALKSATVYYYVDGKLRKLLGARTDVDFSVEAGGPLEMTAKITGLYQGDSDVAMPASPAFGTADPPITDATIAFTIGGYATGVVRKFTFGTGNKIESNRGNMNAATGSLATPSIRDRQIPFSVLIEEELVATIDMEGWRRSNTGIAIGFTIGATQYAKWNFAAANARVESKGVKVQDSNGTQLLLLSGHLYDSAPGANDAFALKAF
jgi:hypothetical protein